MRCSAAAAGLHGPNLGRGGLGLGCGCATSMDACRHAMGAAVCPTCGSSWWPSSSAGSGRSYCSGSGGVPSCSDLTISVSVWASSGRCGGGQQSSSPALLILPRWWSKFATCNLLFSVLSWEKSLVGVKIPARSPPVLTAVTTAGATPSLEVWSMARLFLPLC
jgi:hypothetical protein